LLSSTIRIFPFAIFFIKGKGPETENQQTV